MKDRLKKFVQEHRQEFDDVQLPDRHLERFNERLEKTNKPKKKKLRYMFPLIAAAAAIALLIIVMPAKNINTCQLSPEMTETKNYYSNELAIAIEELKQTAGSRGEIDPLLSSNMDDMQKEVNDFLKEICGAKLDEGKKIALLVNFYESQLMAVQNIKDLLS